jgi:hypothetical protein
MGVRFTQSSEIVLKEGGIGGGVGVVLQAAKRKAANRTPIERLVAFPVKGRATHLSFDIDELLYCCIVTCRGTSGN